MQLLYIVLHKIELRVKLVLQFDTSCQQSLLTGLQNGTGGKCFKKLSEYKREMFRCMWEVRKKKNRLVLLPNCVNVWLGTPGARTVLQLLPMALAAQPPFKQTTEIKRNIGHCSLPWECRQLWRRKHFNSPLSSICACGGSYGCRRPLFITTDRLQICWFVERWEEAGCVKVSLRWSARWNRPDSGGNHSAFPTAAIDSFTHSVWRCLISPYHSSLGKGMLIDPEDNFTFGTSPPAASLVGWTCDSFTEDVYNHTSNIWKNKHWLCSLIEYFSVVALQL